MAACWIKSLLTFVCLSVCCWQSLAQADPQSCSSESQCGWMAHCNSSSYCSCPAGFELHQNGRDCRNESCTSVDCLQCDLPDSCTKCVSFISVSTGQCLKKCEGWAEMQGDNLVCTESEKDDDDDVNIVVAVVAGVAAGAVLCVIVIIAVCVYIRKTRRNINLQAKHYSDRQMDTGHVKQFPVYDNNAYETDSQAGYKANKIDPLEYVSELDKLRPHADTLMTVLSQVRSKLRAMNSSDARVPTYKGVIHQLCRVLVLIHKKDPVVSIPSDAPGLLQWAHQMLEDHREQQLSSSGEIAEFPIAQISSVDFDFDNPTHPVYATPERTPDQTPGTASPAQGAATPYSTVPIPHAQGAQQQPQHQQHYYSGGKRPGFATISRARSIPNGAMISALEGEVNNTSTFLPLQDQTPTTHKKQGSGFSREDFQSFLINSGEKSDVRNSFNQSTSAQNPVVDTPVTTHQPLDTSVTTHQPLDISVTTHQPLDTSVTTHQTLDTFVPAHQTLDTFAPVHQTLNTSAITHHTQDSSTPSATNNQNLTNDENRTSKFQEDLNNLLRKKGDVEKNPYSTSAKTFFPRKGAGTDDSSNNSQAPAKKNIITNPKAVKKSNSLTNKNPKYAVPNIGYFANGHYYDPNPMPNIDSEVYAPGSSYSDRSNVMSTFLGDLPRSRTPSSSNHSDDGDMESENSGGDLDVFPFDPKDCTEPVEV